MDERQSTPQAQPGCFFCTVAGPQLSAMFERCWPEPTQEHFRNARIEFLKGIRGILDARIDCLSQQAPKGTKLTVE